MYWKYNNVSSSQIETLLQKEDLTLKELLNEEDIINECKLQNKALVNFLIKPENLEELVTLATVEPPIELDERTRFKYAYIACEILICDIPPLNEKLASDEALLSKLYSFLDCEPPLNPLLASYFSEIMCVLIAKKTEQVIDFLKKKENFIPLLLRHIGTSAIMDLTLKLMTQVKGAELRQNILYWLETQKIVQSLVELLDPSTDKEKHYNVAQLLCDFIKLARENQRNSTERNDPDPLLNSMESPETISLLLDHILSEKKIESCIVGGIQVLLALLDFSKPIGASEENNDVDYKKRVMENTISTVLKRLKDFHELLLNPPKRAPLSMTMGILEVPLGNTRLQVTRLFANLIATYSADVIKELMSLGTFQVLLDLFFRYPWNNFLHTQVEACITSALKAPVTYETGDDNALYMHLIVNCKLVERILEAWKDNDEKQSQTNGLRQGYMGHLTNIANSIANTCSTSSLGEFLKSNLPEVAVSFEKFTESTLQETNKMREILLGGANPSTSNDDSDEYGDVPFAQSPLLQQQVYAQYQIQQLAPPFIESYGFNDDDFNDREDTLQTIDHRTNMNFDLSEGDLVQQHEYFKQICSQSINTLDDADDQIFEEKDPTFQTVIEKQGDGNHGGLGYHSSDSEDESPPGEDPFMDIDPWSSPNSRSESAVAPVSTTEDPWRSCDRTAEEGGANSWADFSSATFANFDAFDSRPHRTGAEGENIMISKMVAAGEDMRRREGDSGEYERRQSAANEVAQIVKQAAREVAKKIGKVAGGDHNIEKNGSSAVDEDKPTERNELIDRSSGNAKEMKIGTSIKPEQDKKGA